MENEAYKKHRKKDSAKAAIKKGVTGVKEEVDNWDVKPSKRVTYKHCSIGHHDIAKTTIRSGLKGGVHQFSSRVIMEIRLDE